MVTGVVLYHGSNSKDIGNQKLSVTVTEEFVTEATADSMLYSITALMSLLSDTLASPIMAFE